MKNPYDIVISPIISEKSYRNVDSNKYTFKVHKKANKVEIRDAISKIFNVIVVDVNTIKVKGKPKKLGLRAPSPGKTPDWKKAVVTLAEGDKIEFFESKA